MNDLLDYSVSLIPLSQSQILMKIECLIQSIAQGKNDDSDLYEQVQGQLATYLSVYKPDYDYSEHIDAFWQGCHDAGILHTNGFINLAQWQLLADSILSTTQTLKFKRRVSNRRYQTKQNAKSIQQYARELHSRYSRLLVVRVDLYYRADCQHEVGIGEVYEHLAELNASRYRSDLFEHLEGSAWCLEQGETRGYHIHAIYYFQGSKHQNDWYMASRIGELWEDVTDGNGTYHSCNTRDEKEKYDNLGTLGVGMIHRTDSVACENAVYVASYLANYEKEDQYLRMKPKGRRVFATGL